MKVYIPDHSRPFNKKKIHDGSELFTQEYWIMSAAAAVKLNRYDYTCIKFKDGIRKQDNFISSDCMYLDFDHVIKDDEDIKQAMRRIIDQIPYRGIAIPSSSLNGFHFLIPFSEAVNNVNDYKKICEYVIKQVKGSDEHVKDGARYAFATLTDEDLFKDLIIKKHEPAGINVKRVLEEINRLSKFDFKPHYHSNYNTDEIDTSRFDVYTEGGRNDNTYKLACSLLAKCPNEEEARRRFDEATLNSTLPEREKEQCWKSACNFVYANGTAFMYSNEAKEERRSQMIKTAYRESQAPDTDDDGIDIPLQKVKDTFFSLYGKYGYGAASKCLQNANAKDLDVDEETLKIANSILKIWAENEINPKVLDNADYALDGKDPLSLGMAVAKGWQKKPNGLSFIPEMGAWYKCNPKSYKWEKTDEGIAISLLKERLLELANVTAKRGCHDEYLVKNINKTISQLSLKNFSHLIATVSFDNFQTNEAHRVATPDGVFELTESGIEKHGISAKDFILNTAATSPDMPVEAPYKGAFDRFLKEIVPDTTDRQYLKTVLGAQILGSIPDYQKLFIWQGEASNGKSTLFNAIQKAIGDYAGYIRPEALSGSLGAEEFERELSKLMNKRIVLAQEPKENLKLDSGRLKQVCSTDAITASKKYVNPFTFMPIHTTNLICNSLPVLSNTDDQGLVRRISVFKFTKTFKGKKADPTLPQKLDKDMPEILKWLMEGACDYLKAGRFPECPHVDKWTDEYLEQEDDLAIALKSLFIEDPNWGTSGMVITAMYNRWAAATSGMSIISAKVMGGKLQKKGFICKQVRVDGEDGEERKRLYVGLKINTESEGYKIMEASKWVGEDGLPFHSYKLSGGADNEPQSQSPIKLKPNDEGDLKQPKISTDKPIDISNPKPMNEPIKQGWNAMDASPEPIDEEALDDPISPERYKTAGFKDKDDFYQWIQQSVLVWATKSNTRATPEFLKSLPCWKPTIDLLLDVFAAYPSWFEIRKL